MDKVSPFSFMTIGDWGGASLEGGKEANSQYYQNTIAVAQQMATISADIDAKFVVNTGDSFYWCGIQNTSDMQIKADFEEPYLGFTSLQQTWYSVLGNHEYGYNVLAQIAYTDMSDYWHLPDRYYTERITLDASQNAYLSMIFIDSSPCVADYRQDDPKYWDPCSTQYPTCSHFGSDDDFEGECRFHQNILEQSCEGQFEWLVNTLKDIPKDDWLVIVGHHPLDEVNVQDFTGLIQAHGFDLYLNGHAHTLTQYTLDGGGAYVTSGAGAMVDTADQSNTYTKAKVMGEVEVAIPGAPTSKPVHHYKHGEKQFYGSFHTYQTVFNKKVAGFTYHSFNSDYSKLTTYYMDYEGNIIHHFSVDKNITGRVTSYHRQHHTTGGDPAEAGSGSNGSSSSSGLGSGFSVTDFLVLGLPLLGLLLSIAAYLHFAHLRKLDSSKARRTSDPPAIIDLELSSAEGSSPATSDSDDPDDGSESTAIERSVSDKSLTKKQGCSGKATRSYSYSYPSLMEMRMDKEEVRRGDETREYLSKLLRERETVNPLVTPNTV